jgi:hypothetical protein
MFNISSLFNGIGAAATKLLTLAATDEESIFTFTNDHPMVKSAIQLAEQEVGAMPQVAEAETIASAVLGRDEGIGELASRAYGAYGPTPRGCEQ